MKKKTEKASGCLLMLSNEWHYKGFVISVAFLSLNTHFNEMWQRIEKIEKKINKKAFGFTTYIIFYH